MNTRIILVLLWEQWRQTWKFLAVSALILAAYAITLPQTLAVLYRNLQLDASSAIAGTWLIVLVALALLYVSEGLRGLRADVPRRMFTLPLRTGTLLAVHLLYRIAIAAGFGLALGLIIAKGIDPSYPLWLPVLVLMAIAAWMQAFVCMLTVDGFWRGALWFTFCLLLVAAVLLVVGLRWLDIQEAVRRARAVQALQAQGPLSRAGQTRRGLPAQRLGTRGTEQRPDGAQRGRSGYYENGSSISTREAAEAETTSAENSDEVDRQLALDSIRRQEEMERERRRFEEAALAGTRLAAPPPAEDKPAPGVQRNNDAHWPALAVFSTAFAIIVAWIISLNALTRARSGSHWPFLPGAEDMGDSPNAFEKAPGPIRRFMASPVGTQAWFEWRNAMCWLPRITLIALGITFAISGAFMLTLPQTTAYHLLLLRNIHALLVPGAVTFAVGYYALRSSSVTRLFCATRPISTGGLAAAKLLSGAVAVAVVLVLVTAAYTLLLINFHDAGDQWLFGSIGKMMSLGMMTGYPELIRLAFLSTFVLLWTNLFLGRLIALTAVILVSLNMLIGGDAGASQEEMLILLGVVVIGLFLAALLRVSISRRYWVTVLAIVFIAALGPLWNFGQLRWEIWAILAAEHLLMLAPFAYVPLVVHWNRHR